MATYTEIYSLMQDGDLLGRTAVALVVAADAIRANGSATVAQHKWATQVLGSPIAWAPRALALALVQNKTLALLQLKAASDAALQSAVDGAVTMLVAGNG